MKINKSIIIPGIIIALLCYISCDSMEDNFKQYLGEYNYSGKIDSLRVYPGFERVVLAWDNPRDQKSKTIRVIYGPDSTVVNYDTLVDSISIDGLDAGTGYDFTVYTLDAHNNLSVPVSITAFPVSQIFVDNLLPPSFIVEVQNNEQVVSLIGLSNVLMLFSGKMTYEIVGPNDLLLEGEIDISAQVEYIDPETGLKEYNAIENLSLPVTDFGVEFLPPGEYIFTSTTMVRPIMGNQVSIDEIALDNQQNVNVPPIIINITILGGTVSDAYNTGGGEGIEKLVDGDHTSKYLTGNPQTWAKFRTDNPAIITRYSLTSGNDAPDRDPLNWTLEGSNDDENWTLLDQRTGIDFPNREQTLFFDFENQTMYQYYKLSMQNNAGNLFQLAEWTLYGPKLAD